jgi:hypothetical protein
LNLSDPREEEAGFYFRNCRSHSRPRGGAQLNHFSLREKLGFKHACRPSGAHAPANGKARQLFRK